MRVTLAVAMLLAGCDAIPLIDHPPANNAVVPPTTPPAQDVPPACKDGVRGAGESDVDCGGPDCAPCADGLGCGADTDCAHASCQNAICISCSDGVLNGTESDIDCGGSCTTCDLGRSCNRSGDCTSRDCNWGICSQPLRLSFAAPIDTTVMAGSDTIAVGDFDGDQRLDVVTSNSGAIITVLFGNRKGGFPERLDVTGNSNHALSIVTGDFDRDGRDDVAFGGTTGTQQLTVMLGRGERQLGMARLTDWPAQADSLALGDFNGDHVIDIATSNRYAQGVVLGLGDGVGGFAPGIAWQGNGGSFSSAGDFNGDGISDLALADGAGQVDILLGGKNKLFVMGGAFMPQVGVPVLGAMVAGDLNNDGRADLVTTAWYYPNSWVLLGNGAGKLKESDTFMPDPQVSGAAAADFDLDGNLDVVFACDVSRTIEVFRGDGKGGLSSPLTFGPFGSAMTAIAVGDFNGDKMIDIVATQEQGLVSFIRNTSN